MIILGIHFGHDSSLSLLENGKIISSLELERIRRLKHSIGISAQDIQFFLKNNKRKISDIDFCAVTSSQGIESIFLNKNELSFKIDQELIQDDQTRQIYDNAKKTQSKYLQFVKRNINKHPYLTRLYGKFNLKKKFNSFASIEDFYLNKKWTNFSNLKNLKKNFYFNLSSDFIKNSMSLPIELNIFNKAIKGRIISHHYAHAAYAFYSSNFKESLVFTQDGSLPRTSYWGGMCYAGIDQSLIPVLPHFLNLGKLYEQTSEMVGFDSQSGPGKMMGLAPYGKPIFFHKKLIGNIEDLKKLSPKKSKKFSKYIKTKDSYSRNFFNYILSEAFKKKYKFHDLGNKEKILSKINIDIASTVQKWLEITLYETLKIVKKIFIYKKMKGTQNLCLSGGTFLNCPANSYIYNKKIFRNIFIPPGVHDGGLSIGACLAIYYNHFSFKRKFVNSNNSNFAFLGLKPKIKKINFLIKKNKLKKISSTRPEKLIAKMLDNNKIVAIFFENSEIGPRALGHRSILANPKFKDNWLRVNKIKNREHWRPFAPIVLDDKVKEWFSHCPKNSPFMLFTAKVLKPKIIPAVSHVDASARIQTVNKSVKPIYQILKEFYKITDIPVLLNTSFNGPGEPIVEKIEEAISFFNKTEIDYLMINNDVFCKN